MASPFIIGLRPAINGSALLDTRTLCNHVGLNTGNLAFHAAIDSHFGGNLAVVSWNKLSQHSCGIGSIGIVPAANQLNTHSNFGRLAEKFASLTCKIVMVGLGAQSDIVGEIPEVSEGTIAWVRQIAEHHSVRGIPNISVRGPFSKQVLERYGLGDHAVILGCPSLFINPAADLGVRIAARVRPIKRIAVAAGLPQRRHLSRIEQSLAQIVTATGGSYVGQHPLTMIQLTRGEAADLAPEELRKHRNFICPEMESGEFIRWAERHGNVFFDIFSWMEHYRRFDFVIGSRIHGVMLALQAGVPGVCIVHDSRTLELCETMMVPYVLARDVAAGITREQLPDLFKFDAAAFDENRRVLAGRYLNFLSSNELEPADWLGKIAAS